MKKQDDPVVDEIRLIRHQISERFHHDPERLMEYYIDLQGKYQNQVLLPETDAPTEKTVA